jgi:hypothetical protein
VGRDRVLHLRRCGVCVRLGAPGWGRGLFVLVCAGVCVCYACVCVLGGRHGAAHRTGGAPPRSHPAHLRSVPSFCLSACLPCLPRLPAAPPPPPPQHSQPRTRRAPGGHQAEVGSEVGLKSGGCRPELGRAAAAHRAGGRAAAPHLPPEAPRRRPLEGVELRGTSGVLGQRGAPAALVQLLSGRRGAGRRRGPRLG